MFKTYHFTSDVISQQSETFQLHFFFLFLRLRSLQVDTLAIVLLKNQDITSLSDRYQSTSFDACIYFAQLKDEKESVERVHLFQLYLNIQTQKRKFLGQFIPATNPNKKFLCRHTLHGVIELRVISAADKTKLKSCL